MAQGHSYIVNKSLDSSPIAQESALFEDRDLRVIDIWVIVKAKEPLNLEFNNRLYGKGGNSVKRLKIYTNVCMFVNRSFFSHLGIECSTFSDS